MEKLSKKDRKFLKSMENSEFQDWAYREVELHPTKDNAIFKKLKALLTSKTTCEVSEAGGEIEYIIHHGGY